MNHTRWKIPPPIPAEQMARWPGLSPLMVQLLHNRGVIDQYEPFLAADKRLAGDPFLLSNMDRAVARIQRALLHRENIAIYGDFDADGITATVLLTQGLSALGGHVIPYIPHRIEEGYGLNSTALDRLFKEGISLVITVDCGITAAAEVEWAQKMGLDIIITDHHTVPAAIPPALAVINPKRPDSAYPFAELAGVGVAFKLLQALLEATGRELALSRQSLDLVALGTVADLVPLLGENRYLAKQGLEVLNHTNRLGLREMATCAGLGMGQIDSESIAYFLAPRLNAAGRLDHAITSYHLLNTNSPREASKLAQELEVKNRERQRLTSEVLAKARDKLATHDLDQPLLMVGDPDYPSGVVGVAAGKLSEEFYRPVIVLELGDEESRGSARSISEFNIISALTECKDLLSRFGGHARAAGFTLSTANIDRLHRQLLEIAAERLAGVDLRPFLAIDAEVQLSSLRGETFKLINKLAPFGQANPAPTFLSRGVKLIEHRSMGSGGEHLRLKLRDGNVTWDAVGFKLGRLTDRLSPRLDIVYNLRAGGWGETEMLELNLLDFAPASLL